MCGSKNLTIYHADNAESVTKILNALIAVLKDFDTLEEICENKSFYKVLFKDSKYQNYCNVTELYSTDQIKTDIRQYIEEKYKSDINNINIDIENSTRNMSFNSGFKDIRSSVKQAINSNQNPVTLLYQGTKLNIYVNQPYILPDMNNKVRNV